MCVCVRMHTLLVAVCLHRTCLAKNSTYLCVLVNASINSHVSLHLPHYAYLCAHNDTRTPKNFIYMCIMRKHH